MKKTVTPNSNVPVIKEGFGLAAKLIPRQTSSNVGSPSGNSPVEALQLLAALQKIPEAQRKPLLRSMMSTARPGVRMMKKGGLAKKTSKPVKAQPRKK